HGSQKACGSSKARATAVTLGCSQPNMADEWSVSSPTACCHRTGHWASAAFADLMSVTSVPLLHPRPLGLPQASDSPTGRDFLLPVNTPVRLASPRSPQKPPTLCR